MILPGVTIGEQAIVAARALVHDHVPPNAVVGGVPAKVMRDRRTEGRSGKELDHIWLRKSAFQDEHFTGRRVGESVSGESQRWLRRVS